MKNARAALALDELKLKDKKIFPKRLRNSERLRWKIDKLKVHKRSSLFQAQQQRKLAQIMAKIFPEYVATLGSDNIWYSGGRCVHRWYELRIPGLQNMFLWNHSIEIGRKSDRKQCVLKLTLCLPFYSTIVSEIRINIVSDSTLFHDACVYGLAGQLHWLGMLLMWHVVRPSAKAEQLLQAWDKAPPCTVGLTIWN